MWRTRGHNAAIDLLKTSLTAGTTSHAYLFTGPAHTGKSLLALELAMALNCTAWQAGAQASLFEGEALASEPGPCYACPSCTKILAGAHPDVAIVQEWVATRTPIIDQVRAIQYAAGLLPYEGRWKVYGLLNADQLTLPAQNALLKTLEEPAPTVRIILTAPSTQSLLPTVVSRCQQIPLRPPSRQEVSAAVRELAGADAEQADFLAGVAGGRIGWALQAAADESLLQARTSAFDQLHAILAGDLVLRFRAAEELAARAVGDVEGTVEVLRLWLSWMRDLFLIMEDCPQLVTNSDQVELLRQAAKSLPAQTVLDSAVALQRAAAQVDGSTNTRLALEVLMIRLPSLVEPRSPAAAIR